MTSEEDELDDWEVSEFEPVPIPTPIKVNNPAPPPLSTPLGFRVIETGSERTEYVPQVRILKRDPKASGPGMQRTPSGNSVKTVAEREADYREARARIFAEETTPPSPKETRESSPRNTPLVDSSQTHIPAAKGQQQSALKPLVQSQPFVPRNPLPRSRPPTASSTIGKPIPCGDGAEAFAGMAAFLIPDAPGGSGGEVKGGSGKAAEWAASNGRERTG